MKLHIITFTNMKYDVLEESFTTFNRAYRYAKKNGVKVVSETFSKYVDRESNSVVSKTFNWEVK